MSDQRPSPPSPPAPQIDPKSGYCAATNTFHSIHPKPSLPPPSLPLSLPSFAFSFLPPSPPPSRPAFIDASTGAALYIHEFLSEVRSLCVNLLPRVCQGDVVMVLSPAVLEVPVIYFSLLWIGAVVSPVNPAFTDREVAHLVSICKPSLAFVTGLTARKVPPEIPLVRIDSVEFGLMLKPSRQFSESGMDLNLKGRTVRQSDAAAILYSSGTTGRVKGVVLTHRNLMANLTSYVAEAQTRMSTPAVLLLTVPLFHVYGFVYILKSVAMSETCVVQTDRFDARRILRAIERFRVTNLPLAPPALLILVRIVEEGGVKCDLSSLQRVTCGGAPIGKELIQRLLRNFPNVSFVQGYGLTETTSACFRTEGPEETNYIGSVGRLIAGFEAKIVDPVTGVALPPSSRGEIWIRGQQVMKGYIGDDESSSAAIDQDGWLKTGDIGLINDDGFLYVFDRMKELIKCRGYQVSPVELEDLLQTHQDIIEAAVVPFPDEEAGEVPIAFVVRRPGRDLNENQIKSFISEKVAPYKRIRHVFFIDSIPKNPGGKILRRKLKELASLQMASKL